MAKESALKVIILPDDESRQEQLKVKLKEYEAKLDPNRHTLSQMDTIYKKAILERLLKDGKVDVYELCRKMSDVYGSDYFKPSEFETACAAVEDYCKTGGANCEGGTGLPRDGRLPGNF